MPCTGSRYAWTCCLLLAATRGPDRTVCAEDVYLLTTEASLLHGTLLDGDLGLAYISLRELASGFPTWVPDLRCHSHSEVCVAPIYGLLVRRVGPLHAPRKH